MLVNIVTFLFLPFAQLSSLHFKVRSAYMPSQRLRGDNFRANQTSFNSPRVIRT